MKSDEVVTDSLVTLFGAAMLAQHLGVRVPSLQRYRRGDRPAAAVRARLQWLTRVAHALAGTYVAVGVLRWFGCPRAALGGHAPLDLLVTGWRTTDAGPSRIAELADSLR